MQCNCTNRIVDCAHPRCKRVVHFNRLKPAPIGHVPVAERIVSEEEHTQHSGDTVEKNEEAAPVGKNSR